MARVLVTGASGFVGAHVVRWLVEAGHEVRASGRDATRLSALTGNAELRSADLASDDLGALLSGCDAVVHCAALSAPWGRAGEFWRANVLATERLLTAARTARVRRFVHLGSPSIYFRFQDQLGLSERFTPPRRWITEYARTKWLSECRVREAAQSGLPALVLRPRAVFGEGDRAILPRLLAMAERGWFPLLDQGRALIDVTHVDNLARLICQCIDTNAPGDGRAYNVSNGEPVRVRTLLETVFKALARPVRLVALPRTPLLALAGAAEQMAKLHPSRPEPRLTRYGLGVIGYSQTLDITRARRELNYQPSGTLDAALTRYAQWLHNHDPS